MSTINKTFGDLEIVPGVDTGLYGFGSLICSNDIKINGTSSSGIYSIISSNQTSTKNFILPNITDSSDKLISDNSTSTLTNKNITSSTNTVYANGFLTSTGVVVINSSSPASAGQALITTGSDTATWQSVGAGGTSDALLLTGGTMQGIINMDGNRITNLPAIPSDTNDAVSEAYVITLIDSDLASINSDIALLSSDLTTLTVIVNNNTSDIANNLTLINNNTSDIANNLTLINNNTSDIANNLTLINNNTSDIANNLTLINNNTSDIAALSSDIPEFVDWTDWSPSDVSGLKNPFTVNMAKYTRIGNKVSVLLDLDITKDQTSDTIQIGGLPFSMNIIPVGTSVSNPIYIIDNSDITASFGRIILNTTASDIIDIELLEWLDSHGYSVKGQFFYPV